mmetsp:Transcript_19447/g.34681  ORF Transcript_19447/g.34681 Transcript_19447/m.34681 type:complete len:291 (-) Transcript_19447:45-917(-)
MKDRGNKRPRDGGRDGPRRGRRSSKSDEVGDGDGAVEEEQVASSSDEEEVAAARPRSKAKKVKVADGEAAAELAGAEDGHGEVRKVILVLDEANLEAVKSSRGAFELLNCDDHLGLHKKLNKNPADSRPDIAHQMLLAALDSPLNKAGNLEVYIRTNKNVLIKVSEHLRIPRTFKRFSGLIVQLLHKMKIRAVDGNKTLLKVIKNPITRHLPPNARIFASEVDGTLVDAHEFVPALPDKDPVVFVLGAFARGNISCDYASAKVSFSEYPLSGACTVSRILGAFERKWGII